ncbi:hypothetical protein TcasGA2_TC034665 [Tribolium castaneum]|uniref:Uncharacterized protein n=1 Tax=Tribolium castaneum TaxID=7070 RepID=A0A139WJ68_TRICA|nr:hypothetical protein TcasGA2_TC034665 [Tribolium castaneum]
MLFQFCIILITTLFFLPFVLSSNNMTYESKSTNRRIFVAPCQPGYIRKNKVCRPLWPTN